VSGPDGRPSDAGEDLSAVPRANLAYRFAAAIAMSPVTLQRWDVRVDGLQHVPRSGGAVLVCNHHSFVDFFTVGRAPYRELGRPLRILAKASLFKGPLLGPIFRAVGHIPVDRGAGAAAFDAALEALARGELVAVLPEQTISPSFELLPFKTGAVRMAQAAGVPIVPAVSWGSQRFWTTGHGPRPTWRIPVSVRFASPLRPGADDDPVTATAALRGMMTSMLDDLQRSYPDGAPAGARWVPARLGGSAPTVEEAEAALARLRSRWTASRPADGSRS
jgi:1-acyl-sn-glycerol-3-phosphate acyltransferase